MAIWQSRPFVLVDSDAGRMLQLFERRGARGGECLNLGGNLQSAMQGLQSALESFRQAVNPPRLCGAVLVLLLAYGMAGVAPAQQPIPPASSQDGMGTAPTSRADRGLQESSITPQMQHHMAERRNDERQKALVADTDRLLALAQQLKAEVDKTDKDQLSVDVVKRAEQIEKLARSVKEKMRGY